MKKVYRSPIQRRYAAMTEYLIILAVVALGSIAIFTIFGNQIRNVVSDSSRKMAGQDAVHDTSEVDSIDENVTKKTLGDF